jgi:hypothetical protein
MNSEQGPAQKKSRLDHPPPRDRQNPSTAVLGTSSLAADVHGTASSLQAKRGHCARAGQNNALRLQPGVGGEKHNRLFLFSPLRACRTKKRCFGSSREWGKEAPQPTSFSSLQARRTETCAFVVAFFFWGGGGFQPGRGWGKETQPLVIIFNCAGAGRCPLHGLRCARAMPI